MSVLHVLVVDEEKLIGTPFRIEDIVYKIDARKEFLVPRDHTHARSRRLPPLGNRPAAKKVLLVMPAACADARSATKR